MRNKRLVFHRTRAEPPLTSKYVLGAWRERTDPVLSFKCWRGTCKPCPWKRLASPVGPCRPLVERNVPLPQAALTRASSNSANSNALPDRPKVGTGSA